MFIKINEMNTIYSLPLTLNSSEFEGQRVFPLSPDQIIKKKKHLII